ncbi:MAG: flagellar protein FliS [Ignavibacteria bacterium]|nr:flagellar protein FliS [Ignavibacteria bacterium]
MITAQSVRKRRANSYLVKEILEASPQKLILKIYDFAIANCQRKDMVKTNKAVSELIISLNFEKDETKPISMQLLRLYQFVQDQTRKGEFDIALQILSGLRTTWQEAFEKEGLKL